MFLERQLVLLGLLTREDLLLLLVRLLQQVRRKWVGPWGRLPRPVSG